MFAAIILAAGRSRRMGRPKALLTHGGAGVTFVAHLIRISMACHASPVIVVGRGDAPAAEADAALPDEVARYGGTFVMNQRADDGQLSSLLVGLDTAEAAGVEGIVVLPVDVPMITEQVVSRLLDAAAASPATIIRAAFEGRHGHPVLFKRALFDELRRADPALGARMVVRADPARVLNVEVGEPGVTRDLDTPEDYVRAFGAEL